MHVDVDHKWTSSSLLKGTIQALFDFSYGLARQKFCPTWLTCPCFL